MNSYASLINMPYKRKYFAITIILFFIVLLIISWLLKSYDEYNSYGVYVNNHIFIDVPNNNSDALIKGKFVKIDEGKYNYRIINISKLKNQEMINYQTYEISVNKTFYQNEVVKITFYYHPQKIIKKIINILF